MNNVSSNPSDISVVEKECRRLWHQMSSRIHQPKEYDFNTDVLEINHSLTPDRYHYVRKDFSIFKRDQYKFFETIKISIDDTNLLVTPIELAKLIFLSLAVDQKPSSGYISAVFNGVCAFFALMKGKPIDTRLKESDYQEYFGMILSFSPTSNGLVKRLSAPSYAASTGSLNLSAAIKVYRSLSVPFAFDNLSKASQQQLINRVCLDVIGMTFQDYKSGGSFNFLGLEIGKHYIDHCANIFEANFQLALALRKTHSRLEKVLEGIRLPKSEVHKSTIIGRTLTGGDVSSIVEATKLSSSTVEAPHRLLLQEFRKQFNDCSTLTAVNKFEVISQIIQRTCLPDRFDTYEFVRSMLMAEFINDWGKPSKTIFLEYIAALSADRSFKENKNTFNFTHKEFIDICNKSIEKYSIKLPSSLDELTQFLKKQFADVTFVSDSLVGLDALKRLYTGAESAGCTLFVALTGWRRSEFGFPMSSLKATINTEVLDNLYTPWRFNVNWKVPKTHGDAKIDREITSYAYQIMYMASELNLAGDQEPALYVPKLKKGGDQVIRFQSATYISHRVDFLWLDFINNYVLFGESYANEYPELTKLKSSLHEEIPAYEFWRDHNKSKTLKLYCDGVLDEKTTELLNEKLSNETKDFLKDKNNVITRITIKSVTREVMADLSYPTPHAFRHIWAEAVLTRYRGDIGKYLRANFKHMDARFFAAYLRNKEMKAIHQIAERTIINQIVRNYIRSANQDHQDYAGGFQRYITKAVRMTKVITLKEHERLADKIGGKVISIKANSWCTCMLRSGNQHRAKCSEDGVPQRRNAAPEFCLGCMHADISEMNFDGIVISVKNDVMACRNDNLPEFVKEQHAHTLKLALARVSELKKNSGKVSYDKYIDYLKESISMASGNHLDVS